MWGKCRACEAKEREIEHLLALLNEANERADRANARMAETVAPGVVARTTPRPILPPREPEPERELISFPGYEREFAPPNPRVVE